MISHISHSLGKFFKSTERSYWVLAENGMVDRLWWFCSVISIRHKKCDVFDILMTIIPGENMITRQINPFFHLLFQFYSLVYFIFVFQDLQNFVASSLLGFQIRFYILHFECFRTKNLNNALHLNKILFKSEDEETCYDPFWSAMNETLIHLLHE